MHSWIPKVQADSQFLNRTSTQMYHGAHPWYRQWAGHILLSVQPKNTALNDDRNKQNISFECGRYFCQTGVIYATLFLYFGMNTEPLSAFSCSTVI